MTTENMPPPTGLPVIIVGAGISGLLLAQTLRREGLPFRIFERSADFTAHGIGWGLTLHWSLPVLRSLLPDELSTLECLRSASVDRKSVEAGVKTRFPFIDVTTNEVKFYSPAAEEDQRIRVTRDRLRRILATGIDIEWEKDFESFTDHDTSITATFEDGTACHGSLIVGCDGGYSKVRNLALPEQSRNILTEIPVRMLGFKLNLAPDEAAKITKFDSFFMQCISPKNNVFLYISILDAPGNNEASTDQYTAQLCISWPYQKGFLNRSDATDIPKTNDERHKLIKLLVSDWPDPWKPLVINMPPDTTIKALTIHDFAPPLNLRTSGNVTLAGDAFHLMTMYRGEGANHAIVDVLDFHRHVISSLKEYYQPPQPHSDGKINDNQQPATVDLRASLDLYEEAVVSRTNIAVMASRQACLDAHDATRISASSPLVTKRQMYLDP